VLSSRPLFRMPLRAATNLSCCQLRQGATNYSTPQVLSSRAPFRMHFRVVTRGNNPNLVLENCREALEVLRRSGLPEARYKVDVATDKHMHTMSEVPEVHEIVVVSASG
jgi:hypothetical protein